MVPQPMVGTCQYQALLHCFPHQLLRRSARLSPDQLGHHSWCGECRAVLHGQVCKGRQALRRQRRVAGAHSGGGCGSAGAEHAAECPKLLPALATATGRLHRGTPSPGPSCPPWAPYNPCATSGDGAHPYPVQERVRRFKMVPGDLHRQGPLSGRTTDGMMATSRLTMLTRSMIRMEMLIMRPAHQASTHLANCLSLKQRCYLRCCRGCSCNRNPLPQCLLTEKACQSISLHF